MGYMSKLFLLMICMFPLYTYSQGIDKIIASVNNQIITSQDLDDYTKMLAYRTEDERDQYSPDTEMFKKEALDRLIEDKLILAKAKEMEIVVPEPWIAKKLKELIGAYPNFEAFEKSLIERGQTITTLKEKIREQFLVRYVVENEIKQLVTVSPQEVTRFYEKHPDKFSTPVQYVLWIAKASAQADLEKIGQAIMEKGIETAKNEYKDSLMQIETQPKELKDEIAQMVDSIKPGNYSIAEINKVFHLVYFEKIIDARTLTLKEAWQEISGFLWQTKFQVRFQEWLAGLKRKAVIKVYSA